jgi:hypothetical protein
MGYDEEMSQLAELVRSGRISHGLFESEQARISARYGVATTTHPGDEPSRASPAPLSATPPAPKRSGPTRTTIVVASVVVVAAVVGATLALTGSPATTSGVPTTASGTGTSVPGGGTTRTTGASVEAAASVQACIADATTIETAVRSYNAVFDPTVIGWERIGGSAGIVPGHPSTYAHGAEARKLVAAGDIASWASDGPRYAISLATPGPGRRPGDLIIYVPPTNPHGVDFASETSSTGCNAIS